AVDHGEVEVFLTWPRGGRDFAGQFTRDPSKPQEISLAAVMQPALVQRAATANLLTIADLLTASRKVGLEPADETVQLAVTLAGAADGIDDAGFVAGMAKLRELCEPVSKAA